MIAVDHVLATISSSDRINRAVGLGGVKLVISDCHQGLKNAIAAVLPGAGWQRCRTHFVRNLLGRVPKSSQQMVATLVRSVFMQPDTQAVREQHGRVVEQLEATGFHKAARLLVDAAEDILAFGSFPKEHWKQSWSNNPVRHEAPQTVWR